MTSKSLFFKLLGENLKRRTWALALAVLGFFFALPINLALTMQNAVNSKFWRYNQYEALIFSEGVSEAEKLAKILEIKTGIVLEAVRFGNGLIGFLIVVAAVVIGVSSFSYLHNRRKVDFYHSIPVRREMLFAVQYTGGFLIVALAYLVNLLLLLVVGGAYGVPLSATLGTTLLGWALNLLFFLLMYAVVSIAMIMTGNMLVGVLGSGVFFFYMPAMVGLMTGYCTSFFETMHYYYLGGEASPFVAALKWTSPVAAYIIALSWGAVGEHIPALVISFFIAVGLTLLALALYRRRPSEAAGKAMAFKWSMLPIRALLVFAFGMSGGIFFWALQSTLAWAVFGAVMGSLVSHCVIEIIYHFDFKKLFSHKLQLAVCLACVLLSICAFRYDWFRYDSYLPDSGKVAGVALEIEMDNRWINYQEIGQEDGKYVRIYQNETKAIMEHMKLTDVEPVLAMADLGRKEALKRRADRMNQHEEHVVYGNTSSWVVTTISGEDGADADEVSENYYTQLSVVYTLNSGRKVYRTYHLPLSAVMDSYKAVYDQPEYKQGVYSSVMDMQASDVSSVTYTERGKHKTAAADGSSACGELLAAYQADLNDLTVDGRLETNPIGQIQFTSRLESAYLEQEHRSFLGQTGGGARRQSREYYGMQWDITQPWPVYPSFERTIKQLEIMGMNPGSTVPNEMVKAVTLDISGAMNKLGLDKLEDEELKKRFPVSGSGSTLEFTEPENIALLMSALSEERMYYENGLCPVEEGVYVSVKTDSPELNISGNFQKNLMTPEIIALFKGTPLEDYFGEKRVVTAGGFSDVKVEVYSDGEAVLMD